MDQPNINQVVAAALRWHMEKAGVTAKGLGRETGLSPRTIGNFLNPGKRTSGSKGKEPSGKLFELAVIAQHLKLDIVELVSDWTEDQREEQRRLRMAAHVLKTGHLPANDHSSPEGKRHARSA